MPPSGLRRVGAAPRNALARNRLPERSTLVVILSTRSAIAFPSSTRQRLQAPLLDHSPPLNVSNMDCHAGLANISWMVWRFKSPSGSDFEKSKQQGTTSPSKSMKSESSKTFGRQNPPTGAIDNFGYCPPSQALLDNGAKLKYTPLTLAYSERAATSEILSLCTGVTKLSIMCSRRRRSSIR